MFTIALKRVDDRCARQIFSICADTLFDAERFLVGVLQVQFDTRCVVLVYNDDLIYHVYADGEFVGVVQIRLDG